MAQLLQIRSAPTIEPAATPPDTYNLRSAPAGAFGGQVGKSVEQVGKAGEQLGAGLFKLSEFYDQAAAEQAFTQYQHGINNLLYGDPDVPGDLGHMGLKGEDALKARQDVTQRVDQLFQQARGGLTTGTSQREFDRAGRRLQESTRESIGRHTEQAANVWGASVSAGGLVTNNRAIANNYNDDEFFKNALGDARGLAVKGSQHSGKDATEAVAEAQSHAVQSRIQGAEAQNDYGAAKRIFDSYGHMLDSGVRVGIATRLRTQGTKGEIRANVASIFGGGGIVGDGGAAPGRPPGAAGGVRLSIGEMRAAAERAGFKGEAANIMAATAMAESGGNPHAANEKGEHSYGITQINADAHGPEAREALGDPDKAMQLAYRISKGGTNFTPWMMYENGGYKKYLAQAQGAGGAGASTDMPPVIGTFPKGPDDNSPMHYERAGGGWAIVPGEAPANQDAAPLAPKPPVSPSEAAFPDKDVMLAKVESAFQEGRITQEVRDGIISGLSSRINLRAALHANETRALKAQLTNGAAALADGKDFPYDEAHIRYLLPPPEAEVEITRLNDAKEFGQVKTQIEGMAPADIIAERARLSAGLADPAATGYIKRRGMLDTFDKVVAARKIALVGDEQGKHADPVNYVIQTSPMVREVAQAINAQNPQSYQDYLAAVVGEQQRLGVPAGDRSVLTRAEANAMVNVVTTADPEKFDSGLWLAKTQKEFGDYWQTAYGDLVKAGLPSHVKMLAAIDNPSTRVDFQNMLRMTVQKGGAAALEKSVTLQKKEIDAAVEDKLNEFHQTVNDSNLYNDVEASVRSLAYYYAHSDPLHTTATRALDKAYRGLIEDKYDFSDRLRVPKGQGGVIEAAGDVIKSRLSQFSFGSIPGNPDVSAAERLRIYTEAIPRSTWVMNKSGDGAILQMMLKDGQVMNVRLMNGDPVGFQFDQAAEIVARNSVPPRLSEPATGRRLAPAPGSTILPR